MQRNRRTVRAAKQLFRLCQVGGSLDPNRVKLVVDRVIVAKRRGCLAVGSEFARLVRLDLARHRAQILSATPLPDHVRADLMATVARLYGSRVETEFAQDASLLGGMQLTVGSDVYDGSVRARLAAIQSML